MQIRRPDNYFRVVISDELKDFKRTSSFKKFLSQISPYYLWFDPC